MGERQWAQVIFTIHIIVCFCQRVWFRCSQGNVHLPEGYYYFGAARELPGVRELFEKTGPVRINPTYGCCVCWCFKYASGYARLLIPAARSSRPKQSARGMTCTNLSTRITMDIATMMMESLKYLNKNKKKEVLSLYSVLLFLNSRIFWFGCAKATGSVEHHDFQAPPLYSTITQQPVNKQKLTGLRINVSQRKIVSRR